MRIKFAGQWLHEASEHPANIRVNGTLVYESVDIILAAQKKHYARGNRETTISFTVPRLFPTRREAEVWLLTGPTSLPAQGELEIVCGNGTDIQQSVIFPSAVLHTTADWSHTGSHVQQTFQLVAGIPTTTAATPTIQGSSDTVILAGTITLTTSAQTAHIAWPAQSAAPTAVQVTYLKPTASADNIIASVQFDTLAVDGCTAELSAPAQAGSRLAWSAFFHTT